VRSHRRTRQHAQHDAHEVAERPSWRRWAACRETPTAIFFPAGNSQFTRSDEERAKAVCSSCPVRARCLAFAMEHEEAHGVWGGLNPDERRALTTAPATSGSE
jgi:WhiB family redox-sensing transcriptional regulator